MKQVWVAPSIVGVTRIHEIEITDGGVVTVKRTRLKQATMVEIAKHLHDCLKGIRLPVFVDPAYPEIRDHLKIEGYWVVQ